MASESPDRPDSGPGPGEAGATYRYVSQQRSLLLPIYRRVLWDPILPCIPPWISPNALTIAGTLCLIASSLLVLLVPPLRRRWFVLSAVLVLLYVTLDNLDGFHARRTGQSSALGELLDHWLDTLNTGFLTMAVCYAVRMPAWVTFCVLASANLAFFAVHWAHRHAGAMRMGRLADIEACTAAAVILVAAALVDPGGWATLAVVLAVAMCLQSCWTVARALGWVRTARRDWLPLIVATIALGAVYAAYPSAWWPVLITLGLLNSLCTGRMITDRVCPPEKRAWPLFPSLNKGPGPFFGRADRIGTVLVACGAALLLLAHPAPAVSSAVTWGLAAVLGVLAALDLASGVRGLVTAGANRV